MQQSTACLHFRGYNVAACGAAVGRLGVAACLACVAAEAVDWQAHSLVLSGVAVRIGRLL